MEVIIGSCRADQALQFVLSWYETIKLDRVRALREGSEWTSNPVRIDERLEAAQFMAAYADTLVLDTGRVYTDVESEEEEEEAPAEEEGSSDSTAAGDGSGEDEDDEDKEVAVPEAAAPEVPQATAGADVVMAEAANTSAEAAPDAANASASANPAADPQTSNPAT